MKKIAILLIPLLFLPFISNGETYFLKLRASHHPEYFEYLRIVLEGPESIISSAIVNQKAQNVVVTFPDKNFTIQAEKVVVAYSKIGRDAVMFYPGSSRGLRVFSLEHPNRLVIDVYKDKRMEDISTSISPPKEKKKTGSLKIKTVVIDPGHGGYESGLVKDNYREKNVVLDIAKKLSVLINRGSSRSFLTRKSDRFMTQRERIRYTNSMEADIFISLHVSNQSGIVIYIPVITEHVSDVVKPYLDNKGQDEHLKDSVTLLNAMKEAVITDFGYDMVSVQPLPYSMLSKIEAAALLIELPSFEDAYYVGELRAEIANTLYKGLYIYEEIGAK